MLSKVIASRRSDICALAFRCLQLRCHLWPSPPAHAALEGMVLSPPMPHTLPVYQLESPVVAAVANPEAPALNGQSLLARPRQHPCDGMHSNRASPACWGRYMQVAVVACRMNQKRCRAWRRHCMTWSARGRPFGPNLPLEAPSSLQTLDVALRGLHRPGHHPVVGMGCSNSGALLGGRGEYLTREPTRAGSGCSRTGWQNLDRLACCPQDLGRLSTAVAWAAYSQRLQETAHGVLAGHCMDGLPMAFRRATKPASCFADRQTAAPNPCGAHQSPAAALSI